MTLHIWIWVPRFPCIIYKHTHCSFTSQDALLADLSGSLLNAKENTLNQQNSRANWTWTKRKSLSVSSGACQSTKCWWWPTRVAQLMQKLASYHAQCSRRGTRGSGMERWRDAGSQRLWRCVAQACGQVSGSAVEAEGTKRNLGSGRVSRKTPDSDKWVIYP